MQWKNSLCNDIFEKMDSLCLEAIPFFFMIDFEMEKPVLISLEELNNQEKILVHFPNYKNCSIKSAENNKNIRLDYTPISEKQYQEAFEKVYQNIQYGNSYLCNLTFATRITLSHALYEIFLMAKAPFKLWYQDHFCCFSPEPFITIKDKKISTFPMKGTIDANLPDAEKILLNDSKESAEHATVVDLLRNDLSQVADMVEVSRYRYLEKIETAEGNLLQSSSEIKGVLKEKYQQNYGSVLKKILPAGSVSGAPKEKTLSIIQEAEKDKRGYYTGVMGVFDGKNLESAVMIRFIEQKNNQYFYRSGGGITSQSIMQEEYDELLKKIYVPIF